MENRFDNLAERLLCVPARSSVARATWLTAFRSPLARDDPEQPPSAALRFEADSGRQGTRATAAHDPDVLAELAYQLEDVFGEGWMS
jgi:hypothetical protein